MRFLKYWMLLVVFASICDISFSQFNDVKFSTAGFYKLKNNESRQVFNFNNGWRFYKGNISDAFQREFLPDSLWEAVQLPHGIEILPSEASGGINYQGVVWYRKKFTIPESTLGKRKFLKFEAIMGKCKIWLNGVQVKEHKGGYLPVIVELNDSILNTKGNNILAVMADNSDDATYPIGKPQYLLDFCYFGGIYRDVWFIATDYIFITDANEENKVAGGGVFVHYEDVSEKMATVVVQTDLRNRSGDNKQIVVENYLQFEGERIPEEVHQRSLILNSGQSDHTVIEIQVPTPKLWSPDEPNLYQLFTVVKNEEGKILDGYYQYIGIRTFDFKGEEGFFLNGKPYAGKLMGVNHHQDYALIGNAVPNNLHWQDAKLMRDAGIKIVRGSHYPQDPAFMDACDQLGIFMIVCTPGWQFWNKDPVFEEYVISDIRNMIRRDRNHPSVLMWEPLLNETHVLGDQFDLRSFTKRAYYVVHEEYPYKDCFAAANPDKNIPESELFDIIYEQNPINVQKNEKAFNRITYFTREWGDNVDDFYAHNSDSRAARNWGEVPQLTQALHYANPKESYGCWELFYNAPKNLIGGALWHFFDTERGYHPDPFYGGIVDNFRQKKYSYYMFQSQQDPDSPYLSKGGQSPYFLTIANEITPFSPGDVTVFTNCDSVQLIIMGQDSVTLAPDPNYKMPHPPIIFKNVYRWSDITHLSWSSPTWEERDKNIFLFARGFYRGNVVIETMKRPGFRPVRLKLSVETEVSDIYADGSTIIPVVVSVVDDYGTVKRLNNTLVNFKVEGEGILIDNALNTEQRRRIEWGTTSALIRTTLQPGKIRVIVSPLYEGKNTLLSDTLLLQTSNAIFPSIYDLQEETGSINTLKQNDRWSKEQKNDKVIIKEELRGVEMQQRNFGENK